MFISTEGDEETLLERRSFDLNTECEYKYYFVRKKEHFYRKNSMYISVGNK